MHDETYDVMQDIQMLCGYGSALVLLISNGLISSPRNRLLLFLSRVRMVVNYLKKIVDLC